MTVIKLYKLLILASLKNYPLEANKYTQKQKINRIFLLRNKIRTIHSH